MWVNNVIYYALLSGISGIYRARDTTHKCCHKFCTAAPQDPRLHQCVCEWVECSSRLLGIPGYDSSDDVFTAVSRGTYSCSNNLQFICHIYIHIARVCVCCEKRLPLTPPPFCWRAANAILQGQQHGVERNANASCEMHATCPESRGSTLHLSCILFYSVALAVYKFVFPPVLLVFAILRRKTSRFTGWKWLQLRRSSFVAHKFPFRFSHWFCPEIE